MKDFPFDNYLFKREFNPESGKIEVNIIWTEDKKDHEMKFDVDPNQFKTPFDLEDEEVDDVINQEVHSKYSKNDFKRI